MININIGKLPIQSPIDVHTFVRSNLPQWKDLNINSTRKYIFDKNYLELPGYSLDLKFNHDTLYLNDHDSVLASAVLLKFCNAYNN